MQSREQMFNPIQAKKPALVGFFAMTFCVFAVTPKLSDF